MGKKGVEEKIKELEIFIGNCKFQPLSSNKIVVPKDEIDRLITELKLKLPSEIERCKKIMRNKEAILASARTRSDAIISESVNEANRLVDTNHITELANIRAGEILDAARDEADRIIADANAEANEVRLSAMNYTRQKLADMRETFAATLEADRENYKNLIDNLENTVYTLDTNLGEVDTSIGLLTGAVPVPAIQGGDSAYPAPQRGAAPSQGFDQDYDHDDFDAEDDDFDYGDEDDSDEDSDDDFDEEDDFEDDFLDE